MLPSALFHGAPLLGYPGFVAVTVFSRRSAQLSLPVSQESIPMRDQRGHLADIPVRVVHEDTHAGERGTILFYHGFSADIDGQTKELTSLAEAGYLVIGVDAVGHGVRRYDDFDARYGGEGDEAEHGFLELVRASAAEIPRLIDTLVESGLARTDRIGLGGISMGGYIAYRAVCLEPRLKVVAPILGSPRWDVVHPDSPHLHPDRFFPTALLSQNASLDEAVPPEAARGFHRDLATLYAEAPERLAYVEHRECGHFMPEPRWIELWDQVLRWFGRFMPGPEV